MNDPYVVAVMITGKDERRRPFAQESIRCFLEQTYGNRGLLILNSGQPLSDSCVKHGGILEEIVPDAPLGTLRNRALDRVYSLFPEAWVIQWDDDDWSAPDRIALQVATGLANPGAAVTLARQLRYSFAMNSGFDAGDVQGFGIFGTVLHPPTELRYQDVGKHEDSRFLKTFARFVQTDAPPETYIRLEHGFNTWSRDHIMRGMRGRDRFDMTPEAETLLRMVLEDRYAWFRP